MNKEEAIEKIKNLSIERNGISSDKGNLDGVGFKDEVSAWDVICILDKIDEPQKPVVPKFMAVCQTSKTSRGVMMEQKDFYEVNGCTDFIPVKFIGEHKYMTNTLNVELTETGNRTFVPHIYSFPKVNEPQKVTVPKFVGEWIEECKHDRFYALHGAFANMDEEMKCWRFIGNNSDLFARAWLDGYEIEQEKLYTVEIPNPNNEYCMNALIRLPSGKIALVGLHRPNTSYLKNKEHQLTEAEIKEDFDWAWDAGFAKEVE